MRWFAAAAVCVLVSCPGVLAQVADAGASAGAGGGAEVKFERDWPQQAVPFYRIDVRADGSGEFSTDRTAGAAGTPIHVSQKTWLRLIGAEGVVRAGRCDAGSKHLAQTGMKTLTVVEGGTTASCAFNYSGEKRLQDAVDAFSGIATTLEERAVIEHLRRYDRLGLDAELGSFLETAKSGRAIELENLAPLLRELAGDEVLMERVRGRAATLLGMADNGS